MVKKSFTLIELLFVIVILSFVLIGSFRIVEKLYKRNYIAKTTAKYELITQQTLDYIAGIIYYRIPLTTIGYRVSDNDFKYIGDIDDDNHSVIEWIGYNFESFIDRNMSSFIDMDGSDKNNNLLKALDFNATLLKDIVSNKFNTSFDYDKNLTALLFSGSFDRGEEASLNDYNSSFGWHGNKHKYIFTINDYNQTDNDTYIKLREHPNKIYERFFIGDSAYAIALKKDLNSSNFSNCKDLDLNRVSDDSLLLFYNYRPWNGETFCADNNGSSEGNVSILMDGVKTFRVRSVNSHLELLLEVNKTKNGISIYISKQKVVF